MGFRATQQLFGLPDVRNHERRSHVQDGRRKLWSLKFPYICDIRAWVILFRFRTNLSLFTVLKLVATFPQRQAASPFSTFCFSNSCACYTHIAPQ
jgi:hypothetical protein